MLLFEQGEDLWALPLATGGTPSLLLKSAGGASCSRDGKWMSYTSAESGRPEVYLTTFPKPGRKWQVSPKGAFAGGWWTENEILYVDMEAAIWSVDVVPDAALDLTIGKPKKYIDAPNRIDNGAVHPDGERCLLAVRQGETHSRPVTLVLNWPAIRRP